jgi:hypothetical protein
MGARTNEQLEIKEILSKPGPG